jgi:dihydroorotate dehydrogenase electron transfer subunit
MSISRIVGDEVELLFNVVGQGTRMLAAKHLGDTLDVLGPLGMPFGYRGDYSTAVIVAGGVGVAPFPFLTTLLAREGKQIVTFLGARTAAQLTPQNLENVLLATDDGTEGHHGTVVDMLEAYLSRRKLLQPKIFGCGPTNMLKALTAFAKTAGIDCELSLEGDMACGLGLCQGCPIERTNGTKKYALVCVEGPTFNSKDIILP